MSCSAASRSVARVSEPSVPILRGDAIAPSYQQPLRSRRGEPGLAGLTVTRRKIGRVLLEVRGLGLRPLASAARPAEERLGLVADHLELAVLDPYQGDAVRVVAAGGDVLLGGREVLATE